MSTNDYPTTSPPGGDELAGAVDAATRCLPAQGPIGVFIHHNTLHAFEDLPFEEAVVEAGRTLGCQPYLSEDDYRDALAGGRITQQDIRAVLDEELGDRAGERVAGTLARIDLWQRLADHGIPEAAGAALAWRLGETDALTRFRADLPDELLEATIPGRTRPAKRDESELVTGLWSACCAAVERSSLPVADESPAMYTRHRDALLAASETDTDELVHPLLIRFTSAFLDQGLAQWAMPLRDRGLYGCFVGLYGDRAVRAGVTYARHLAAVIADDVRESRDAWSSLRHSLAELGVSPDEWAVFLTEEALALRGWAGMVRQLELRPDHATAMAGPPRLADFLAVRLIIERAAIASVVSGDPHLRMPPGELRRAFRPRSHDGDDDAITRAWALFHTAQLCGLEKAGIDALSPDDVAAIENELGAFDGIERRRVLHQAFERHLRHRFYDGITQHQPESSASPPLFQAVFCIDEREESIRRHLEEVEPGVETLGAAGFFGVAMHYRGIDDVRPRTLCPAAMTPQHYVTESPRGPDTTALHWRSVRDRVRALVNRNIYLGSRGFLRGSFIMATVGALWMIPLIMRVLFPWLRHRLTHVAQEVRPTRLHLDRTPAVPPAGSYTGFTVDEMAQIVAQQIASIGLAGNMSPLVFIVGHGSTSLNNPHESAHDCGACGGGRGGPNARAFAQMANDERVRASLEQTKTRIPPGTWFLGAERNTADNRIVFFDRHLLPASHRSVFARAIRAFQRARMREAHERGRRFESLSGWSTPRLALMHVESRSVDLAQSRPEYGHASNAFCVIGRRARTRGLFLDRRAFLLSYDPTQDPEGAVLEVIMAGIVPVVAGISLEYYFGYVDPTGYGSGSKLPHNVTSLLGVMDGAQSDLRTGLPWQMLEIHEPVRVSIVVECAHEVLVSVLHRIPSIERLVRNRWIIMASIDPTSGRLIEIGKDKAYRPSTALRVVGDSVSHYRGKRGHLPFVRIHSSARGVKTP